jgi:hypothetical protein
MAIRAINCSRNIFEVVGIHTAIHIAHVMRCTTKALCEPVCPAFCAFVPDKAIALGINRTCPDPAPRHRARRYIIPKALGELRVAKIHRMKRSKGFGLSLALRLASLSSRIEFGQLRSVAILYKSSISSFSKRGFKISSVYASLLGCR